MPVPSQKRYPWPFKVASKSDPLPEQRNPASPGKDCQYPHGDHGDQSGKNLEQPEAVRGIP